MGGISIWQLLIVLVIVLLLFGTKRLRNLGGDLGGALKGFRDSMQEGQNTAEENNDPTVITQQKTDSEQQQKQHDKTSS